MPLFAFNYLKSFFPAGFNKLKVLMLGVSYLSNVGDKDTVQLNYFMTA